MPHIVLDDEQAKVLANAHDPVELRDRRGGSLGIVTPNETIAPEQCSTDEDVALAKQRAASDAPRYTTQEVLEYLASLDTERTETP